MLRLSSIRAKIVKTRANFEVMSKWMEDEQKWFLRQWQRSEGLCDGGFVVKEREFHEMGR